MEQDDQIIPCFICENKECVNITSNVCDRHKLLVCDHGYAKKSVCIKNKDKCDSLCTVTNCDKNKQYLLDGKVTGGFLSGSVFRCIDHINSCRCGKRVARYIGLRGSCIGCYNILSYPEPEENKDIMDTMDTDSKEITEFSNDPITVLELTSYFVYRKHLDYEHARKIIHYLDVA